MALRRTSKVAWGALVLIVGWVGLSAWGLFVPHVVEPEGAVSAERASSFSRVRVPAEARNIRIAGWSQLNFIEQYMRFEAPPEVCLRVAAEVFPGVTLKAVDLERESPLSSGHVRPEKFRDLSWFDLGAATHLVHRGGGSFTPEVWVDLDRGVFYYAFSD